MHPSYGRVQREYTPFAAKLPGDYHNTTEPPHGRANVCDTPPRAHSRRVSTESKSCVMAMPPRRFVGRGI